ncbi:MAG: TIR domain-containing protein [Hyphomonadaceae bacterium]
MTDLYRYAAFISYSSKDGGFAKRLHRALERYAVPRSLGRFDLLGGGGKRNRIYPVFRDREELPAGELGPQIQAALKASNALIVVCSPNSAASPWVQKEIEFFVSLGRRDRVFAIVADTAPLEIDGGDATPACFPPAFLSGSLEPIAADTRKGRDGFRNAWLKIVSGLIGVSPGALADRDKRRRRIRTWQAVAASVVVLFAALFGSAGLISANLRERSASLAELAERAIAEGRYDRAARYARLGLVMSDWPLIGYLAPEADAQLRRVVVSWDVPVRLVGHSDEVTAGALSLDGAVAATGSGAGEIRIWSMQNGEVLAELPGAGRVETLEFSADGTRLLVVRDNGTAEIRQTNAPRDALALRDDQGFKHAAFGGAGRLVATVNQQGSLAIWNAETGQVVRRLGGDDILIASIAFNAQGDRLITSGSMDGSADVWNASTGARVFRLTGHEDAVYGGGFSPNGNIIQTASRDGAVRLWSAADGRPIGAYRDHGSGQLVMDAVFSPDSDRVASYSPWENAVRLWNIDDLGFQNFSDQNRVVRLPDGYRAIAVGFHGGGLRLLVARTLEQEDRLRLALGSGEAFDYAVQVWEVWATRSTTVRSTEISDLEAAAFDPSGERIVAGGQQGVAIWNAQTGAVVQRLQANQSIPWTVSFSANGERVVAGFSDGAIQVWDAASGSQIAALSGHQGNVRSAVFSPDGARVASASADGSVRVWDVASRRVIGALPIPADDGLGLGASFDPSGTRVLVQMQSSVRIWEIGSDAAPIEMALAGEGRVIQTMWRGDGAVLVATTEGMALFDARDGALLNIVSAREPVEEVWQSAFDPFGLLLAVSPRRSELHIIDVASALELDVLRDQDLRGAAFSPDGRRLVSWSPEGLQIWTLDPALSAARINVMEYVCALALADGSSLLTDDELREAPMLSAADVDACALDRVR